MTTLEIIIELLEDAGLLVGFAYLYALLLPHLRNRTSTSYHILTGILFGLFGMACMVSPVVLSPGYFFDNRNVMVAISGLLSGLPGALLSTAMVASFRLALGGEGATSAIFGILTAATISVLMQNWIRRSPKQLPRLLLLGCLIAFQEVGWLLIANPPGVAYPLFSDIALPLIALHIGATALIGTLLTNAIQQQAMAEALQESHNFVERITHAVPDSLYVFDLDEQRLIFLNRDAPHGLGYSAAQMLEMGANFVPGLTHPDDLSKHWGRIERQRHLQEGEILEFEFRMKHANGEWHWVSNHETAFTRHPDGTVRQVIGFSRDITLHKQAETQAHELQLERERGRILQQFTNDASHDLKTPLTIMQTGLYLLRRKLGGDADTVSRIDDLQAQVDHMHNLVEAMLTMSRLDQPEVTLRLELLDLRQFMHTFLEVQERALVRKGQTLDVRMTEMPLPVKIDPRELDRALTNVFTNAMNFTPQDGHLSVTLEANDGKAVLTLRDSGIGISPDDLPHIFERFYRADKARQAMTGGTGLGLPIAQRIIAIHSGTIDITSEQGKGTTVTIELPLAAQRAEQSAAEKSKTASTPASAAS